MVLNSHDQSYFEIFEAMEKIKPSYVIILIFLSSIFSSIYSRNKFVPKLAFK